MTKKLFVLALMATTLSCGNDTVEKFDEKVEEKIEENVKEKIEEKVKEKIEEKVEGKVEGKFEEKKMYNLASSLTKLAKTVESTVRYKKPPPGISDEELLKLATEHDPGLIEPFTGYILKVFHQSRHGIVLVCTKDSSQGLLEDAGCSAEMDKHLWQYQPSLPCEFTLTVEDICK